MVAPVVEPSGLGIAVPGHLLGLLELRVGMLEIGGDAGVPEDVVGHRGVDPGLARAGAPSTRPGPRVRRRPDRDRCPGARLWKSAVLGSSPRLTAAT